MHPTILICGRQLMYFMHFMVHGLLSSNPYLCYGVIVVVYKHVIGAYNNFRKETYFITVSLPADTHIHNNNKMADTIV